MFILWLLSKDSTGYKKQLKVNPFKRGSSFNMGKYFSFNKKHEAEAMNISIILQWMRSNNSSGNLRDSFQNNCQRPSFWCIPVYKTCTRGPFLQKYTDFIALPNRLLCERYLNNFFEAPIRTTSFWSFLLFLLIAIQLICIGFDIIWCYTPSLWLMFENHFPLQVSRFFYYLDFF